MNVAGGAVGRMRIIQDRVSSTKEYNKKYYAFMRAITEPRHSRYRIGRGDGEE
jgi:hypothetical protein